MKSVILAAFLLQAALGFAGGALRTVSPHEAVVHNRSTAAKLPGTVSAAAPLVADEVLVKQLRAKLTKVSDGFSKLLGRKIVGSTASFSETIVGATMSKVETELQTVLAQTQNTTDTKKALTQLQAANSAVQQMSKDINEQQERLMHENDEQAQSLLLGVLMQRQNKPVGEQLKVLSGPEFSKLPVVAAVLAAKDMKTPLFKQVAAYLDAHAAPKEAELSMPSKLSKGKDGKPDVTPIVLMLEARVRKMVENEQRAQEKHQEEMMALDRTAEEKKNNTKLLLHISEIKKHDTRTFAKQFAMAKHDIKVIQSAIESVKKGDMAGLTRAEAALNASMKATEARAGHFLVLIQFMNRAEGRDCPYCVAQCVGKCHDDGKPYATCLTTCADAGK